MNQEDEVVGSPTQQFLSDSPPEGYVTVASATQNHKFKQHRTTMYCGNCGKKGHTYKYCREPIISVGIIAFSSSNYDDSSNHDIFPLDTESNASESATPKFLMICRKDSFGFVEFMRGRYSMDNLSYLKQLLMEMTSGERERIRTYDFDTLWNRLWMNETKSQFRNEYKKSKKKFEILRDDSTKYGLNYYDNLVTKLWSEPEWGFPKGRRNLREVDLDCAVREFSEETGIDINKHQITNGPPITEEFMGTNNVRYRHIYYMAHFENRYEVKIDPQNKSQVAEVGQIKWMSVEEGLNSIRPYNNEKKIALSQAYKYAKSHIKELQKYQQ